MRIEAMAQAHDRKPIDLTKLSDKTLDGAQRGCEQAIRECVEDLERYMRKIQAIREEKGRRGLVEPQRHKEDY